MHPNTQALLRFFNPKHDLVSVAKVAKPFYDLAHQLAALPKPEATVALRKLLEAQDAAVRAVMVTIEDAPEDAPEAG